MSIEGFDLVTDTTRLSIFMVAAAVAAVILFIISIKNDEKIKLRFVFSVISFSLSITLIIFCYSLGKQTETAIAKTESELNGARLKYDNLLNRKNEIEQDRDGIKEELEEQNTELFFWRENAVIVTTTGEKYHRFDCKYVRDRPIYIYNVENAIYKGYTACMICDPPTR